MKKLILGIAMFFVGMTKFVDIYNISIMLRYQIMGRFSDYDFLTCIIFGAIALIIAIAGLVIAFMGLKEKKIKVHSQDDAQISE